MALHVARSADLLARKATSGLPYLDAVTTKHGAQRVWAALVVVPPGTHTPPHYHPDTETVIYQTKGRVKTYYGPNLENCVETGPGDFLYIGPGEIHLGVNESGEPAEAVMFRDNEVEKMVVVPVPLPPGVEAKAPGLAPLPYAK